MSQLPVFSNSPAKASSIIGTHIVNPKNDSLGEIKELVVDPQSGSVAYAVVAFGGLLGMGKKLFAVPFGAFEYDVSKNEYVLGISNERLQNAPGFDPDNWPAIATEQWNRDIYKYYDRRPYWE